MNTKNAQPLSCSTATAWIHLLLDRALAPEQHEKLVAHLQTCAPCRARHRELAMIEAAHAELEGRALAPPEDYFAALPRRVMARIAAAEQPAPVPAREFARQPRSFHVWEFIFGRGRYALAFAAMMALVFVITRQLREQGAPEKEAVQSIYQDERRPSSTPPDMSKFSPQNKTREAAAPVQPQALPRGAAESPQAEAKAEQPAASVENMPATSESMAQLAESAMTVADEIKPAPIMPAEEVYRDTLAATSKRTDIGALQFVLSPQTEPPAVKVESIPQEAHGRPQPSSSAFSSAAQSPSRSRMKAPQVSRLAPTTMELEGGADEINFQQALARAARAQTEAERIKIWQKYLGYTKDDSASYNTALENVARRLTRAIDSSASVARVQEALIFYQTMAPVLVTRLGREGYEREKTRWEGLLNWKKSLER